MFRLLGLLRLCSYASHLSCCGTIASVRFRWKELDKRSRLRSLLANVAHGMKWGSHAPDSRQCQRSAKVKVLAKGGEAEEVPFGISAIYACRCASITADNR